ncbi:hypothetical protein ACPV3U_14705 [Vibrio rotiferianus]|uniref:hypothetical protein n=1 Tax=Vibrio rotiferianus TaxID=190895 RepID=UPI00406A8A7B
MNQSSTLSAAQREFIEVKIRQANSHLPESMVPTVHGVGYNSGVVTCSNGKVLKSYTVWKSMLERCYSVKSLECHPTYLSKTVCPQWFDYAAFKSWYGNLAGKLASTDYPIESLAIDSDLILFVNGDDDYDRYQHGYSPHTVLMLPKGINSQLATVNGYSNRPNPDLLTGISRNGKGYRFKIYNSDGKQVLSLTYATQEGAHEALCKQKAQRIEDALKPFYIAMGDIQPHLKYVFSYFTKWENIRNANYIHRMLVTL